jgi:hypothetical protein
LFDCQRFEHGRSTGDWESWLVRILQVVSLRSLLVGPFVDGQGMSGSTSQLGMSIVESGAGKGGERNNEDQSTLLVSISHGDRIVE